MNVEDRRGQARAGLMSPAIAFLADQRVDCRAVDISTTGIALLSPVIRDPGHFLRVNFSLNPAGGGPARWYDADGVVVRVAPQPSGVVLGVQFVVVEDRVAHDVHQFVLAACGAAAPALPVNPAPHPSATPQLDPAAPARAAASGARPTPARSDAAMPDAGHPPSSTGEYDPSQYTGAPEHTPGWPRAPSTRKRPTAEYGVADPIAAPSPTGPAAPLRATPIPRSTASGAAADATPPPAQIDATSKQDLDELFRAALFEVAGRISPRKDRRGR